MEMRPIGRVKSPTKEKVDEGWGEVVSEIKVDAGLAAGLKGLEGFSHVLVIFYMHESSWDPKSDLVRRPQGRDDMPLVGIFAQRAKHRPNPIGVTAVRLVGVENDSIRVRGLDAIDNTPVLDIKPYYPEYDRVEQPHSPEWAGRLMKNYF